MKPKKLILALFQLACALFPALCGPDRVARAALTDEIQVYDAGIADVGN